jgi:hypothetical protein
VELMMIEGSTARLGWLYSAGRLACFLVVAAVLFLLGLRTWFLALGAVLLSAPLSFVVLRPVRLAWAARLEKGAARRRVEKERLRAALRGDDTPASTDDAPASTDGARANSED